ncbi:hypothetical protein AAVH_05125 [Aphelenchoides avenae]|nr:hypothetical protein AAVH_05125 [Aphelenchus avenae]
MSQSRTPSMHHGVSVSTIDVLEANRYEPHLSKVLCRAPAKHQIQLKTADSTTEAREVQEIVVDEHYASACVHTYEFDVTYTENSECTFEAQ